MSGTPSPAGPTPGSAPTPKRKPRVRPVGVQDASYLERVRQPIGAIGTFITLCRRTLAVIAADPLYAVLLVAAPPLLAALSRGVQGTMGLGQDQPHWNAEGHNLLTVLVVGAAFMGLANSIREIVKESAIYRRERASGLSPTVYLMSKFAVLALIACLQSAAFVALALIGRPRPAEGLVAQPLIEIMIDIAAVAIASSALGLAIGALARTADQTTVPLVVAVMFQLVFSSSLFRILPGSVLDWVSWIDPARWGFAATAATTNLNVAAFLTDGGCATVQPAPLCDPRWGHDLTTWWTAIGALVVQTALLLGLTRLFLNRFEPGRRATLR